MGHAVTAGQLFDDLCSLVDLGPRFHGTSGQSASAEFILERLQSLDLSITLHEVTTPGWRTTGETRLVVGPPINGRIESWPMLWSAPSVPRLSEGRLRGQGTMGLWDNSFAWTKFLVESNGVTVAYITARSDGPAAPQPLPAGSDWRFPHLAIGRKDGAGLARLTKDGQDIEVSLDVPVSSGGTATGQTIEVLIDGSDPSAGEVLVCAHYDTFWNTVGAYDNGSGTIVLLELIKQWTERPPTRTIRGIFFAAEEWHLAGSRSLVEGLNETERANIEYVLNLDGLGRGSLLEVSVGPESFEDELTRQIRDFAEDTRPNLRVVPRFPPLMGTDHAPFYAAGIASAHLTFNDWELLHRPEDVPRRECAQNMEWIALLIDQLVRVLSPWESPPLHDIL